MISKLERTVREVYDGKGHPIRAARKIWDLTGGKYNTILRFCAAKYLGYNSWEEYEHFCEFWKEVKKLPNEVLDRIPVASNF